MTTQPTGPTTSTTPPASAPALPRVFRYNGNEFADPDPTASVDAIRRLLSVTFKELANADAATTSEGTGAEARQVITFSRVTGTKGMHPGALVATSPYACLAADLLAAPPLHLAIDDLTSDLLLLPLHADPAREAAEAAAIAQAEREIDAVGRVVAALAHLTPFFPDA